MIYVLIPSYNDAVNLPQLLKNISKSLRNHNYKVVIVDDGSADETREVIKYLSKKYPLERVGYEKNAGPGHAFKFGFKKIKDKLKAKDLIITMEADNSCDFKILNKMIKKSADFDLILASPFAKGGEIIALNPERRLLTSISNKLDSIIFKVPNVKTYSSFHRLYRASIILKAFKVYKGNFIKEDGFTSVVEILIKLHKLKATIVEIPAVLDWGKRKGKSKMKIGKTTFNHLNLYKNYLTGKYK